ncbi:unnamed protein product [Plutella xylostella]|uniref:(diamondback moth) hypothetical protein n=1 Tax=Plutella xylostella TaxID=51655 RepID=A0A8S4DTP8_PLUXY|nr:unnamed protein product [Plutella xylostella]
MASPRQWYDGVHMYLGELGARVVARSGRPADRHHLGKLILQSFLDAPDHVLQSETLPHYVHMYLGELGARVVARSGRPADRHHLGKLILQSFLDAPDHVLQAMASPRQWYDGVHMYLGELGARVVARSGRPADRHHLGKLILQSFLDAPDHVLQAMASPRQWYDGVHMYLGELGARVVARSGRPADRHHLGKLILQSFLDAPDHVLQVGF